MPWTECTQTSATLHALEDGGLIDFDTLHSLNTSMQHHSLLAASSAETLKKNVQPTPGLLVHNPTLHACKGLGGAGAVHGEPCAPSLLHRSNQLFAAAACSNRPLAANSTDTLIHFMHMRCC